MGEAHQIIDPQINGDLILIGNLFGQTPSYANIAVVINDGAKDIPMIGVGRSHHVYGMSLFSGETSRFSMAMHKKSGVKAALIEWLGKLIF